MTTRIVNGESGLEANRFGWAINSAGAGIITGSTTPYGIGSVLIVNTAGSSIIAGSVFVTGSIRQVNEPWIMTGSVRLYDVGSVYQAGPEIATYAAVGQAGLAANRNLISLYNSGNVVNILKIRTIRASPLLNSLVTGQTVGAEIYRIYHFPAGSIGSDLTKYDSSDPNLPSNVILRTGGSEAVATLGSDKLLGWAMSNEETDPNPSNHPIYEWNNTRFNKPITLRSNEGLTIRQGGLPGAGSVTFTVEFTNE